MSISPMDLNILSSFKITFFPLIITFLSFMFTVSVNNRDRDNAFAILPNQLKKLRNFSITFMYIKSKILNNY